MKHSVQDSREIWDKNAAFWDTAMGDHSNAFHREVVRPPVTSLLTPTPDDYILDIACGNGNYSAYLAQMGVRVLAFDYSRNMVSLAQKRQAAYADKIEFCTADATDRASLQALKRERPFTKAVCNMAIMDITHAAPLFAGVYDLLAAQGVFVFATQHPCFVTRTEQYMTAHSYYGTALPNQPHAQCYYHRSLQDLFGLCFQSGFVIDGFAEACYQDPETPEVIVVRARKL